MAFSFVPRVHTSSQEGLWPQFMALRQAGRNARIFGGDVQMNSTLSRLRFLGLAALALGFLVGSPATALAGHDVYPPGWTVQTVPSPQIYEYNVGTTDTGWHATGQLPAPQPGQSARVIYQMVPGGLRYHHMQ
jgi:hypothetical protein